MEHLIVGLAPSPSWERYVRIQISQGSSFFNKKRVRILGHMWVQGFLRKTGYEGPVVSQDCCEKVPQTGWLHTWRCLVSQLWGLWGETPPLPLLPSGLCWRSLASL